MVKQGKRAQAHVGNWDWDEVVGQFATLIKGDDFAPLNADSFAGMPAIAAMATWKGSDITFPDGRILDLLLLFPSPTFSMGAYAIYIDNDIQASLKSYQLLCTSSISCYDCHHFVHVGFICILDT